MTLVHKVSSDWDARIWFEGTGWAERRLEVTPAIAGWDFLSFRTYTFRTGQVIDGESAEDEMSMVLLSGAITMDVAGPEWSETWEMRGRHDVFDGPPYALYLPPGHTYTLTVHADADCAYGRAPATGTHPPRLIRPEEMAVESSSPGTPQTTRIFGADVAEHLVCSQVVIPAGAWVFTKPERSSTQNEVTYSRMNPETGWAVQRLIGPDDLDETFVVRHGDAVVVRGGEHPLAAGPGTDVYLLRFVVGNESAS
jgi:5-deoxy-glucuronate isomerase